MIKLGLCSSTSGISLELDGGFKKGDDKNDLRKLGRACINFKCLESKTYSHIIYILLGFSFNKQISLFG